MNIKIFYGFVFAALQLQAAAPVFPPGQTAEDMGKMVVFLTSTGSVFGEVGQVGLTYKGNSAAIPARKIITS